MPVQLVDAQTLAKDLEALYGIRNGLYVELENIMNLESSAVPKGSHVKKTLDPSPRNKLRGAIQLMTPSYPGFHVGRDTNNPEANNKAEQIERFASTLARASDRVTGKRLHVQAATSALMYSEVDIAINVTQYLRDAAKGGLQARYDRILKLSPILFEVMRPADCFPLFDLAGLSSHSSRRSLTIGDVLNRYGAGADTGGKTKATDRVNVWDYWDYENHYCWVEGASKPLNSDTSNPLGFIPIISHVVEGGDLYSTNDPNSRQPMLYTIHKAGIWAAANINLTLQTSLAFALGAAPTFVYQANMPDKPSPRVDFSSVPTVVTIEKDENYQPLAKNAIDSSILQTWQMFAQLAEQSTMYSQALGQPLQGGRSFSESALMSQQGRLPLAPYKSATEYSIAMAMIAAFDLLRKGGSSSSVYGDKGVIEIDPKELPEVIDLNCNLKLDQPGDERQNAVVAVQLVGAGLASKEWAMEHLLEIEQPKEMVYRIFVERELERIYQANAQQEAALQAQAMQLQAQGGQQPGQMPQGLPQGPQGQPGLAPGMPQQGQTQGQPADMMAQLQQAQPGLPMAQPQDQGGPMPGGNGNGNGFGG